MVFATTAAISAVSRGRTTSRSSRTRRILRLTSQMGQEPTDRPPPDCRRRALCASSTGFDPHVARTAAERPDLRPVHIKAWAAFRNWGSGGYNSSPFVAEESLVSILHKGRPSERLEQVGMGSE